MEYYIFIFTSICYIINKSNGGSLMEAVEFWSKIKHKLTELGKTQEWLCNETGIELQALRNRIYKERFPSIQETLRILGVFGIAVEDFFGINTNHFSSEMTKDVLLIPVVSQVFSAGKGQYLPDTEIYEEYISVPSHLKKYGKKNLAASKVRGDSMEPTLFDGDTIICDINGYDGTDGIYTIHYKGNGWVKRLQSTGDGVKIISDNPHYEPMFASRECDDFKVIGKVRSVLHNM